jgi:imidazolonepropionase-like amidohydrolase
MKKFRAILCVCFLCVFAALTAAAQITIIKAGKLVDPESGTAAANQTIIVEAGRIKAVGGDLAVPSGAVVIDLGRLTVLPGLFDCHSHLCTQTVTSNRDLFTNDIKQSTAYRAIIGVANARTMLDAGFTTVRDVGNNGNYADTALREAIENGIVPGPTIVNAGRIIAPFGGQYHLQPDRRELGNPEYFFADTRDEMVKAIRENIHFGARVIKIVVDDQPYLYSVDDIRFIVAEAAKAGVKVAAHCMTEQGARNAAEGGVASIEHGFRMSDEALELAKRNNVVLVGTDFTLAAALDLGLDAQTAKFFHDTFIDRLKRAYKIGVTMAYGTDTFFEVPGKTRGMLAISFIYCYTEAGLENTDILRFITTTAAALLGVDKRRGAIRPGLAADIIAVSENPLDNINTLKSVSFVMKGGVVVKK